MYECRDAAYEQWKKADNPALAALCNLIKPNDYEAIELYVNEAFNAGWKARKEMEDVDSWKVP